MLLCARHRGFCFNSRTAAPTPFHSGSMSVYTYFTGPQARVRPGLARVRPADLPTCAPRRGNGRLPRRRSWTLSGRGVDLCPGERFTCICVVCAHVALGGFGGVAFAEGELWKEAFWGEGRTVLFRVKHGFMEMQFTYVTRARVPCSMRWWWVCLQSGAAFVRATLETCHHPQRDSVRMSLAPHFPPTPPAPGNRRSAPCLCRDSPENPPPESVTPPPRPGPFFL